MQASGDRRGELAKLQVPTLVVHGTTDLVFRRVGGRATAAAIPGSRLNTYPGMPSHVPRPLWPSVIDEIVAVSRPGVGDLRSPRTSNELLEQPRRKHPQSKRSQHLRVQSRAGYRARLSGEVDCRYRALEDRGRIGRRSPDGCGGCDDHD
jgi:hypothetical protein